MILKKLVLENWKSFQNRELEFTEGINLIEGDNYAGKSSLIQALYYIFFGKMLFKELTAKELKREGEEEATITLDFNVNSKDYRIRRNIKGGNRVSISSYLYLLNDKGEEDDEIEIFSQGLTGKDNFSKLEEILQSSLSYMENVNFVLEESIYDLLKSPTYKINEDLNAILQLDYLNKISGYCEESIKDLNRNLKSLESKSKDYKTKFDEINHNQELCKEEIEKKKLLNSEIKEELTSLKEKLDDISKLQMFKGDLSDLEVEKDKIKEDLLDLNQELEELQAILDDISRKEERHEELKKKLVLLENNKKELDVSDGELSKIQQKLNDMDKEIAILQDKKQNLTLLKKEEKELRDLLAPFEAIKTQIKNLEEEQIKFDEAHKSIELLKNSIDKSKEIIKNFSAGTCPISQEKCPSSPELIKKEEVKLNELESELLEKQSKSKTLIDESNKIQNLLIEVKKANRIKIDLMGVSNQIKKLEPKIKNLKEKQTIKSDLESNSEKVKEKIRTYKDVNIKLEKEHTEWIQLDVEIKRKEEIIANITKKKDTLLIKNKEKEENQERIESLEKEINDFENSHELDDGNIIENKIKTLETSEAKNIEEMKDFQKELDRIKVTLEKILHPYSTELELQQALEHHVHLIARYDFFKETLGLTLTELSTSKFKEIKEACNSMWATFKEHSGMDSIDWDDNFIPSVRIGGNDRTIYQLSASEKIMIYFSIRSALLANLGPHYFIIVDNLLVPFMKDKQKIILELLNNILTNTDIKQIIFTGYDVDPDFKCNRIKI